MGYLWSPPVFDNGGIGCYIRCSVPECRYVCFLGPEYFLGAPDEIAELIANLFTRNVIEDHPLHSGSKDMDNGSDLHY